MLAGGGLQLKSIFDSSKASRRAATDFAQQQTAMLRRQHQENILAQQAIAAQQAEQQRLREQSNAAAVAAIDRNTRPEVEQQITDMTGRREAGYQTISNLNPVAIDVGSSATAPKIVGDSIARSIADVVAKSTDRGKNRAALEGFNDVSFNADLALRNDADTIKTLAGLNTIAGKMAQGQKNYIDATTGITANQIETMGSGINNALAVRLQKAQNAKSIGDLLFMAGSMGAGGAKGGAGASSGAATPNGQMAWNGGSGT